MVMVYTILVLATLIILHVRFCEHISVCINILIYTAISLLVFVLVRDNNTVNIAACFCDGVKFACIVDISKWVGLVAYRGGESVWFP